MKRRIRIGKRDGEAEGFVWITFSDLLTTLFMVFMVIALWAISNRDELTKHAEQQKKAGEKCVADLEAAGFDRKQKMNALKKIGTKITTQFSELKKSGICVNAKIEVVDDSGGFRIFEGPGLKPWFEEGQSVLSQDAKACLTGIGQVWISEINKDKDISKSIRHIMIEGHANSKGSDSLSEEGNFLYNLGLSQDRAFQASKFLIETVKTTIQFDNVTLRLRELIVAQGKGYLEPVKDKQGNEDFDKSKRLEFKVVLGGKSEI